MTRIPLTLTLAAVTLIAPFAASAASQTITFDAIPAQIFGVSPFVIVARASSGLPVTFTSTTPGVCKLTADLVTLLSAGPCFITASQPGYGTYGAATPVVRSFTVALAKVSGALSPNWASLGLLNYAAVSIATADFNGDGIPDVAVAGGTGGVDIFLDNGNGGFTASPSIAEPGTFFSFVVAGDFNGDGIPDLAVTGTLTAYNVTIFLGDGTGRFTQGHSYSPTAPYQSGLVAGDFNGDGILDLVAYYDPNSMTLLLGDGTGGFSKETFLSPSNVHGGGNTAIAGDFNGDGFLDLAMANTGIEGVVILLGDGQGGFTPAVGGPVMTGNDPVSLATGDFNRDGIADLAVATGEGYVAILLGDGLGGFTLSPFMYPTISGVPVSVAVGDLDGDGIQDIAAGSTYGVLILFGDGSGRFSPALGFSEVGPGNSGFVALADFNGDGVEDVLAIGNSSPALMLTLSGGLAPTSSTLSTTSLGTLSGGQTVALTVAVTDVFPAAFALPAGTVTIMDGTTVLGTASQTSSPYQTMSSYTFMTPGLALGTHALTAVYAGDTRSASSTSNAIVIQVELPQTITFGLPPNVATSASAFALSATASSGDAVSFSSNTPGVCSVVGAMVTIVASGGCSITATQAGDSTYAAAIPVTQSFTVLFGDVATGDNFYDAINAMAQYGITAGCGSNDFCPNANVTRDEMAIFIVRAIFGNDNFTYNPTPYFTDVTPSTFGFKWIQKLKDLGITSGCTATTYCPGEMVARDQAAVFIERARLGVSIAGPSPTFTYPTTPYFSDASAESEFAFPWIQRMKTDGITSGCTATTYCPADAVTRGEMAIFIMRGAFNQFLPAGTPVISSISPSTLVRGSSGTFTITGVNTNFAQGTTVLSPIPGVTIGTVTVNSATSMTVQLTAASSAVAQPYSVLAITGAEQDVLPNGLVLQ